MCTKTLALIGATRALIPRNGGARAVPLGWSVMRPGAGLASRGLLTIFTLVSRGGVFEAPSRSRTCRTPWSVFQDGTIGTVLDWHPQRARGLVISHEGP